MQRQFGVLLSSVAVVGLLGGAAYGQLFGGLGGIAQESTQQIQWALQTADRVLALARQAQQIEHEIRMLSMGRFDTASAVRFGILRTQTLATSVERILWDAGAVNADHEILYPETLPPMTLPELVAHRRQQAWLAREASRNSKISSAAMMMQMAETADRAAGLLAASKACEGQTCAIDIMNQTTALHAETQAQHLMLSAAQGRAVEGLSDYIMGGEERARRFRAEFRRGLPSGGDAGVGAGM